MGTKPVNTQEDIAFTANVLRDHFPDYIGRMCMCGKDIPHLHGWALHVAEVLYPTPEPETVRCPVCHDLFIAENGVLPTHYLDTQDGYPMCRGSGLVGMAAQ